MNVQEQKDHREPKKVKTNSNWMSRWQNDETFRYSRNPKKSKRDNILEQHN